MNTLTDEQIRRHRADTKAKALADNKLNKNWKNKLLEEVDNDDQDHHSKTGEA